MRTPASNASSKASATTFLAWIGKLRDAKILRADLLAGITVALVPIPQSMAYAQLAGLPAYFGLYAASLGVVLLLLGAGGGAGGKGHLKPPQRMTAAR